MFNRCFASDRNFNRSFGLPNGGFDGDGRSPLVGFGRVNVAAALNYLLTSHGEKLMSKTTLTMVIAISISCAIQVAAQTPTATPTPDPALVALQAQVAIMDAKLKLQQDQQALTTGALPSSSTTPNSGAFAVTGANPFPSQRLAYLQLSVLAEEIAGKVTVNHVAIYDATEVTSLVNFKAMKKQLDLFQAQAADLQQRSGKLVDKSKALQRLTPSVAVKDLAPILAPALAEASLKTVIDIIGLFRTNTTIAYSNFTADDAALTAAVISKMEKKGREIYLPATVPVSPLDQSSAFIDELAAIQKSLAETQDQSVTVQSTIQQVTDALAAYIQAYDAWSVNEQLIAVETDPKKKKDLIDKRPALQGARDNAQAYALTFFADAQPKDLTKETAIRKKSDCDQFLKVAASFITNVSTVVTAFGTLQTALMKVTDSGAAALTGILRAEKLIKTLPETDAVILIVKTSVLGGSVVTRTNWWTGGHLLFTGGAIANYTVFNMNGTVAASGVVVGKSGKEKEDF